MSNEIIIGHNKAEYPPMHTAEHILNRTMVNMFGCPRSKNAHIERKKSKCDYMLSQAPTDEQITGIEQKVNEVIDRHLDITTELAQIKEVADNLDISKLPDNTADTIRLVKVGDYDVCACIGAHVSNTAEIGHFKIISYDYQDGIWRVRFKLEDSPYQQTL